MADRAEIKARLAALLAQDSRTKEEKTEIHTLQTALAEFKTAAREAVAAMAPSGLE